MTTMARASSSQDRTLHSRRVALQQALEHVVLAAPAEDPPVAIVSGALGLGSTTMLRRLSRAAHDSRRVIWVQGVRGQGPVYSSGTHERINVQRDIGELGAFLTSLSRSRPERPLLLLVDDLHALEPCDLDALASSIRLGVANGASYVLSMTEHELDEHGYALIGDLPGSVRFDVEPLDDHEIHTIVQQVSGCPLPEGQLPAVLAHAQGVPALAQEIGHAIRQGQINGLPLDDAVSRACRVGIHRHADYALRQLSAELSRLALLACAIEPEGSVAEASAQLGGTGGVRRAARTLELAGLAPSNRDARCTVRATLVELASPQAIAEVGPLALDFLRRVRATPKRLFDTHELFGSRDSTAYLETATWAFEASRDSDPHTARGIAESVMRGSNRRQATEWAHRVLLAQSLQHDWAYAEQALAQGQLDNASTRDVLGGNVLAAEFSLESPAVVSTALHAAGATEAPDALCRLVLAGSDVPPRGLVRALGEDDDPPPSLMATVLLTRAVRGEEVESRLQRFADRCRQAGALSVDAHVAAMIAASSLALADHDAAREWAGLAVMTATERQLPSVGLAHLVAAIAQLRDGDFGQAREHADAGHAAFGRLRASRLSAWAATVRLHVDLEARQARTQMTEEASEEAPPWPLATTTAAAHPLLVAHQHYVEARRCLARDDTKTSIRLLFAVGRVLAAANLNNPTLLNWRPHLAAVLRASGQPALANSVEDDLLKSMVRWRSRNPLAATRRAGVLGERARELFDLTADRTPRVTPHQVDLDALSHAELRVVRLVIKGQSNREVATELFLSKRTVDTHLGRIYRKLGLASRQELTSVMGHHAAALAMLTEDGFAANARLIHVGRAHPNRRVGSFARCHNPFSASVTAWRQRDDAAALLRRADEALYLGKAARRSAKSTG